MKTKWFISLLTASLLLGPVLMVTLLGAPPSTVDGSFRGDAAPVNDAYGSLTQTAGTAIVRVVPPRSGLRARVSALTYTAGTTAHTVYVMPAVDEGTVTSDAAAAQAVVAVNKTFANFDGSVAAASDYLTTQDEDGTWNSHVVSSVSGLNITVSANFAKKVVKGTKIFFHGASSDHTDRGFLVDASTTASFGGNEWAGCGTAYKNGQTILVYSANGTAAGNLKTLSYVFTPHL